MMEYIIHDTDIFDEQIDQKFREIILRNIGSLEKDKAYIFTVSFHLNLLDDIRFENFNILPSKTSKYIREDKIGVVMRYQLKRLEQILNENNIETYSTTIQGDNLEKERMIKIELIEDNSKPYVSGRGKNKKRIKVSSVIPNLPFTQNEISTVAAERMSDIFHNFMNVVKDRKLMSTILGVEETEDYSILAKAFYKEYGELWLTTKEREKELLDLLMERSLDATKKYFEKHKEAQQ